MGYSLQRVFCLAELLFLMKKILIPLSVSLLLVALIAYFLASDS